MKKIAIVLVVVLGFSTVLFFQALESCAAADMNVAIAGNDTNSGTPVVPLRNVISLDGTWQVAEGTLAVLPTAFDHTIAVPGLVDMAVPPFESPGSTVAAENRGKPYLRPADPRREAFWYRRTFPLEGPLPEVARLKIHKACYGVKVFLNGNVLGEHGPNFTPGWFDARPFLKAGGAENELIIRVGASLAQVPAHLNDGWDNEKSRYVPGIFDSVELILSGAPHIANIQTVPDVATRSVRVVISLDRAATGPVRGTVRESKSGLLVGEAVAAGKATNQVELTIPIRDARLWSPEDPFLYELTADTGGDASRTRFGLRSFTTDPATGRALLNGRPYFLRGSNVCIYRFFEDAARGKLPWDREWVRTLHQRFKEMHWNSLRYCIGFPPELWYEIADEEGILIQDEFPIWYSCAKDGWPEAITAEHLAVEYAEWMRERWNHPCVVIWDSQNETVNDRATSPALMAVRDLDLSRRPWDNGWGAPQRPGDLSECHPYRSSQGTFKLANFAKENGIPNNGPRHGSGKPPYLINEYGWLWINRDGSLPTLTTKVYERVLGAEATVEQRRQYYARTLAAKTEFWRGRRQCAGVLHFCGLGYSRPDGQTSDNFVDVQKLVFEPNFFRYVRDAFAPVGVMIDWWAERAAPGEALRVPVRVINDLNAPWKGEVVLGLERDGAATAERRQLVEAALLGTVDALFEMTMPAEACTARLVATIPGTDGKPVCSLRDVCVAPIPVNLATAREARASSECRNAQGFFPAAQAVDGDTDTRWSSDFKDQQWLAVDLGQVRQVSRIRVDWERAFAKAYAIELSSDGKTWSEAWKTDKGAGGAVEIRFAPSAARHVRLRCDTRATAYGFSVLEFEVFDTH